MGDFTTLREVALATAAAGGAIVGLIRCTRCSANRARASPYHPSDRRFLDPIYIDVERVPDLEASPERSGSWCSMPARSRSCARSRRSTTSGSGR